jgi:uncharacterized damage-inducible protein DinB
VNEIDRIADQLDREHSGEPWHGSTLTAILAGVDHRQAAERPLPGAHCIWELVLHLTAWKNEVRHRLAGGLAGEPREGDWPAVGEPSAERWRDAREKLDLAHRLLLSAVKEFREEHLPVPTNDPRADGIAATNYELLMGILQHDVYHAGQIALLARGLRLN